jgi:hypothetical protein
LKENFDRFKLRIHKEKEMVSFRRCILALTVLALFVGLASAQVSTSSSSTGPLNCTATSANPTSARAEGYAELLGDIVITCTGGNAPAGGSAVATANLPVARNNTIVTRRVCSNGLSEALLLIDEPGVPVGPGGPVTALPQTLCTGGALGAGAGGCSTFTNTTATTSSAALCTSGTVPCTAFGTVPNVFQGVVSGNQVIFNGIPILPPVSAGLARVFRITNIRGNAAQFAGQAGSFQGQIPILASVTVSNGVPLSNPVLTTAFLFNGLGATSVRNTASNGSGTSINVLQCGTSGLAPGSVLRFPEGFANAFKTRVNPTNTVSGIGSVVNSGSLAVTTSFNQNLPGGIYNGSESGFILPVSGGTAGLADFGTRLQATFNNVPSGVSIFVSTTNINPLGNINTPIANNATNTGGLVNVISSGNIPSAGTNNLTFLAGLVLSPTAGAGGSNGFLPIVSGTNNNNGINLFGPLPVDANGTATAVWEVLLANPNALETADFAVFYTLAGNPANNTPPATPTGTVSMSFSPTFSSPTASSLIPRFTPASTSSTIVSVSLCQTTLLFPFVNSAPGFDTGIAIANTTADPFGTKTQAGSCTLNFFGSGAGTTTTQAFPSAGGTIAAGTVAAEQASNLRNGFMGYVIAVCNFQLAHGYALFSDTGIRNWATGYLAVVLPTGTGNRNAGSLQQIPVGTTPNFVNVEISAH